MSASSTRPLLLTDNRVPIYYAGGANISSFRGTDTGASGPEDWVGSLTAVPTAMIPAGAAPDTGVSQTGEGSLLDLVTADPIGWLGPDLAAAYGGTSGLLVKILDAGERLPVHCHPSREFASAHLGSVFGKTEGWIIMYADPGARVWLGMRETMAPAEFRRLIDTADITGMLEAMNDIPVQAGDLVFVPAGLPHAIGPGVMLTELQRPTSFSVLADHTAFGMDDNAATLGLGWDLAIDCFDLGGYRNRLGHLISQPRPLLDGPAGQILDAFPVGSEKFFRALMVSVTGEIVLPTKSFAVVVVTDGAGELRWADGSLPIRRGETLVVPHGVGELRVRGRVSLIACLPPSTGPRNPG